MDIPTLNSFCRRYDLVFVEIGREQGTDVYWFIDYDNKKRYYTFGEIIDKLNEDKPVVIH